MPVWHLRPAARELQRFRVELRIGHRHFRRQEAPPLRVNAIQPVTLDDARLFRMRCRALVKLLHQNKRDFRFAISKRHSAAERHDAWRRLVRRRNRAVRLVEELNLRTQRLQPLLEKLDEISQRMQLIRLQCCLVSHLTMTTTWDQGLRCKGTACN